MAVSYSKMLYSDFSAPHIFFKLYTCLWDRELALLTVKIKQTAIICVIAAVPFHAIGFLHINIHTVFVSYNCISVCVSYF